MCFDLIEGEKNEVSKAQDLIIANFRDLLSPSFR